MLQRLRKCHSKGPQKYSSYYVPASGRTTCSPVAEQKSALGCGSQKRFRTLNQDAGRLWKPVSKPSTWKACAQQLPTSCSMYNSLLTSLCLPWKSPSSWGSPEDHPQVDIRCTLQGGRTARSSLPPGRATESHSRPHLAHSAPDPLSPPVDPWH